MTSASNTFKDLAMRTLAFVVLTMGTTIVLALPYLT